LVISSANSKDRAFTASTPAAPVVRSFLDIPLTDSIDFIRWRLTLTDSQYSLACDYGIGKPNTNGFVNGGKKIALTGTFKKVKNEYQLIRNTQTLSLLEINPNLLHILDSRH